MKCKPRFFPAVSALFRLALLACLLCAAMPPYQADAALARKGELTTADAYELLEAIGSGSTSTVYKVRYGYSYLYHC